MERQSILLLRNFVPLIILVSIVTGSFRKTSAQEIFSLPFNEGWTSGSFILNNWQVGPNWVIDGQAGNPKPAAKFKWDPIITNYSSALESWWIDDSSTNTTTYYNIWLDFDIKLSDRTSSGTESLRVEVWNDSAWISVAEFKNDSSFDWNAQHIKINWQAKGRAFKVRYIAFGENSNKIYYWAVDNIHIYRDFPLSPPRELIAYTLAYPGTVVWNDNYLTWKAPIFLWDGDTWYEDFEGGSTPAGWQILQTNTTTTNGPVPSFWTVNDYSDIVSPFGTYHAGVWWDYDHQDEWLITPEFRADNTTTLSFESIVYEGSIYLDHYYVKVQAEGSSEWTIVWDASALNGNDWNYYEYPYTIDLSAFSGQKIKLAFHAVDGDWQGLWFCWFIDNISVTSGGKEIKFPAASLTQKSFSGNKTENIARNGHTGKPIEKMKKGIKQRPHLKRAPLDFLGYNIYRRFTVYLPHGTTPPSDWILVNSSLVSATEYWDLNLPMYCYDYYVTAVYSEGESVPSNIDLYNFWCTNDIEEDTSTGLLITPVPASDYIRIEDQAGVKKLMVYNLLGKLVLQKECDNETVTTINVSEMPPGTYMIKVIRGNLNIANLKFIIAR